MGISDDTFVDPLTVAEALRCSICTEVFDQPVFWGGRPCQHAFCRVCIEACLQQSPTCPTCRGTLNMEDALVHSAYRGLIDELQVKCTGEGCAWRGRRNALPGHLDSCPVHQLVREQEANASLQAKLASV